MGEPSNDFESHAEARIEGLLDALRATAAPDVFRRVEELVSLLVRVYGEGLERLVRHVSEAGMLSEDLKSRLSADELLSSLLDLHGLHPRSANDREAPPPG